MSIDHEIRLMRKVLNRYIKFPSLLKYIDSSREWSYEGKVYCPFHENYESPSAKIYRNDEDGDTLYCFSEHKVYRPSDLFFLKVTNIPMGEIFKKVWERLSEEERSMIEEEVLQGEVSVEVKPQNWEKIEAKRPEVLTKFAEDRVGIEGEIQLLYLLNRSR